MRATTSCAFLSMTRPRMVTSLWPAGSGTYWSLKSPSDGRQQSKPCVRSYPPTAFASFTGSAAYAGNSDADLSRNLAENVDLPAIFRTLYQGVCPGLILPSDDGRRLFRTTTSPLPSRRSGCSTCRCRSPRPIRAVRPFGFPARNGIWRHRRKAGRKKIWKSGISPYLCDVGRATRSAGAVLFFLRFIPPFPRLRCVPGRLSKPLGLTAGLFA